MRGEVILLSRNVRVVGNDSDSWGGQIMVSDNVEETGLSVLDNSFLTMSRFTTVLSETHLNQLSVLKVPTI